MFFITFLLFLFAMAERYCLFTKVVISIKPSKKSLPLLTVFVLVIFSSVFICSVFLKQTHSSIEPTLLSTTAAIDSPQEQSTTRVPTELPSIDGPWKQSSILVPVPTELHTVDSHENQSTTLVPTELPSIDSPWEQSITLVPVPNELHSIDSHENRSTTMVQTELPSIDSHWERSITPIPVSTELHSIDSHENQSTTLVPTELRPGRDNSCHVYDIDRSQNPYVHYPKPRTFSRAECMCTPVRFFVIISTQRSGSGWLVNLLYSHINVSSNGEIFGVEERRENISSILKTLDAVYNLELRTGAPKNSCSAAVGLKWMLNQGLMENHKEIVEYFKDRGVSVIFLFRKNLLRRMVSLRANHYGGRAKPLNGTHKAHVRTAKEAEILSKYKPILKPSTLLAKLKLMEMQVKEALERFNNTRHTIIYYEDLVKNKTKLADVQEFLRLPQMELNSRLVKIHKGRLSDLVKNWSKVRNTLRGTPYQRFLDVDY